MITEYWEAELVTNYKKKPIQMSLILSGITFRKYLVNRPVSTKDFDFIRDC